MANQQAYQAYAQNKGTLTPGQSIAVNKFTVQVERYLSQGGFAHVYLVRTATPVYNTTHHVLKRIAVANDAMLTEVKKEVDIMRLLKGHPNIVHLIDAAWHKMPNGMYEVFILMEFCPGGGIIDMMNRRLRERLTEAEILQIFVDVCEGVAFMHNSRPPLLHRDLKVENILQSSPTSFKLCDFGSSIPVAPRPPANTQEIRELEADLNRHTTLQYRAPEMVDPYLRRPVDEKSDVWALGVLLYKLCYYTTPFEEHGPLAILNVQYRIPPYPVYSAQMNSLIASMLREHGAQRPSAFELLSLVHSLRGTKSQYHYAIQAPQSLTPRHQTQSQSLTTSSSPGLLENATAHRPQHTYSNVKNVVLDSAISHAKNPGVQARDTVLNAVSPMRRGRPTVSRDIKSTQKDGRAEMLGSQLWLESGFKADETKDVPIKEAGKGSTSLDDVWNISGQHREEKENKDKAEGFGDDFAGKLWDSFDPKMDINKNASFSSQPIAKATIVPRHSAHTGNIPSAVRGKDAFEGLGLASNDKPAPTLAEARKLRTGLAATNTSLNGNIRNGNTNLNTNPNSYSVAARPTLSPQPSHLSQSQSQSQPQTHSPFISGPSPGPLWRSPSVSSTQVDGLPAETRFPSLEELDATFLPPKPSHESNTPQRPGNHSASQFQVVLDSSSRLLPRNNLGSSTTGSGSTGLLRPIALPQASLGYNSGPGNNGVRSEQVTGIAMRDPRGGGRSADGTASRRGDRERERERERDDRSEQKISPPEAIDNPVSPSRPTLIRKHRSSISIKHTPRPSAGIHITSRHSHTPSREPTQNLGPPFTHGQRPVGHDRQKDWLTGDDDEHPEHPSRTSAPTPSEIPVLRDSPSKRASYIEKGAIAIPQAAVTERDHVPSAQPPLPAVIPADVSPSISDSLTRADRLFPPININLAALASQESSSALSENWSPVVATSQQFNKPKEIESSSSADEGPEDVNGYIPPPQHKANGESKRPRRKGRQSSVHDLVDLWGGGVSGAPKEREKERETTQHAKSTITETDAIGVKRRATVLHTPRSGSPQTILPTLDPPPGNRSTQRLAVDTGRPAKHPLAGPISSPASARSRPQSMFLFPTSKSNSEGLPSASASPGGLSPPGESTPRANVRRTSISDMVQRYEAIGGKVKSSIVPPVVNPKSAGLKVTIHSTESGRSSRERRTSPVLSKKNINGQSSSPLPPPEDLPSGFGDPEKNRVSPTGLARKSPGSLNTLSTTPQTPMALMDKWPDTRKLVPPTPLGTSSTSSDTSSTQDSLKSGLSYKTSTTSTEDLSRQVEGRSASPERPYQGVGKLIDQWQRKTAESDPVRGPTRPGRGGLVARRAGLVNGAASRGQ